MLLRISLLLLIGVKCASACWVEHGNVDPAKEIVRRADAIVRATALEYAGPPNIPDSRIKFKIVESIRGRVIGDLLLPGHLVTTNDFNDRQPPYSFVRPNGRRGSCYADSYKAGGEFLLFLKRISGGEYTVKWFALGPVNEQLHSVTDKWLIWVREQAKMEN